MRRRVPRGVRRRLHDHRGVAAVSNCRRKSALVSFEVSQDRRYGRLLIYRKGFIRDRREAALCVSFGIFSRLQSTNQASLNLLSGVMRWGARNAKSHSIGSAPLWFCTGEGSPGALASLDCFRHFLGFLYFHFFNLVLY